MTLQEALAQQEKPSKYHSRKVTVDGITFDSAKEARRYGELKLLEKAGEIYDLQRQVPFVVIPEQRDGNGKRQEEPLWKRVLNGEYATKALAAQLGAGVRSKRKIRKV